MARGIKEERKLGKLGKSTYRNRKKKKKKADISGAGIVPYF